jgi:hypothetical protein
MPTWVVSSAMARRQGRLGPRQGLLSRTVDIGPELVATRVGMRPDAPECDHRQKMTTAKRDRTHAANTQCPSERRLPRCERDSYRRLIWLVVANLDAC